jgi:ankyrin repeat protein
MPIGAVTPLNWAVMEGNRQAAKLFLECGADPNFCSRDLFIAPALETLCRENADDSEEASKLLQLARLLISYGASFNRHMEYHTNTLLRLAVQTGDLNNVRDSVELGLDFTLGTRGPGVGGSIQLSPLTEAARMQDDFSTGKPLQFVRYILNELSSRYPSKPVASFVTPEVFISAAEAGNDDVLLFLSEISDGASSENESGFTALHAAAKQGRASTCQILMQLGVPADGKPCSPPPIHVASFYGHEGVVKALLHWGADVNMRYDYWNHGHWIFDDTYPQLSDLRKGKTFLTPLQIMLMSPTPSQSCAFLLCGSGAMLYGGEVSSAVRAQDIDLLHFLLNRGGDPNESSLYAALEDAYLEDKKLSEGAISESVLRASACASCLVDAGVSIRDGDLALAIRTGNRELIAKMVRLGASLAVSTCGAYDTAPLEMAILLGASDVVEAVLQVWPDIYGGGPLCAAVLTSTSNDGFSLVKRLLQNRPLSTTADILETTAVGLAAYLREPEL